ncbi:MAG: glucosaminidase domain-containing protein [Terriglobia bacterium]
MHTLPLPELTDNNQSTKVENGNSIVGCAPRAPRVSNSAPRVSLNFRHLTLQQLQFLQQVTPPALKSQGECEIPACITIAQAILESATAAGWGSSVLFRLANNPFGIKYEHFGPGQQEDREIGRPGDRLSSGQIKSADHQNVASPQPPSKAEDQEKANPQITGSPDHPIPDPYGAFDATTREIENGQKKVMIAQFQRFPNLDEAFYAHALLLRSPRYRLAFEVRGDWKQFAERLGPKTSPLDSEHCGYSTNPSYSADLIKLVSLYRLDDPRALQWYATGNDPGYRAIEPSDHPATGEDIARSTDEPLWTSGASRP